MATFGLPGASDLGITDCAARRSPEKNTKAYLKKAKGINYTANHPKKLENNTGKPETFPRNH